MISLRHKTLLLLCFLPSLVTLSVDAFHLRVPSWPVRQHRPSSPTKRLSKLSRQQAESETNAALSTETLETALNTTQTIEPPPTGYALLRRKVADFLAQPIVEILDCWFVLLSSLLVAISTLDHLPFASELQLAQDAIAVLFVVEFILRWLASSLPTRRHLAQPLVLVDIVVVIVPFLVSIAPAAIVATLPGWLASTNALINLRLLRVLRLQRVLQDMETFIKFETALTGGRIPASAIRPYQLQLARVILSIFTLLSVATGLIYTVEHRVNPNISDYFTALYFGLTTLTTVGFGDITPVTWQGKLIVCGSILAGVAVIPAQGAALVEALLERQRENDTKKALEQQASTEPANGAFADLKTTVETTVGETTTLENRNGESRNGNSRLVPRSMSEDVTDNGRIVLETALACPTCGAGMHWATAKYCWSCGCNLKG